MGRVGEEEAEWHGLGWLEGLPPAPPAEGVACSCKEGEALAVGARKGVGEGVEKLEGGTVPSGVTVRVGVAAAEAVPVATALSRAEVLPEGVCAALPLLLPLPPPLAVAPLLCLPLPLPALLLLPAGLPVAWLLRAGLAESMREEVWHSVALAVAAAEAVARALAEAWREALGVRVAAEGVALPEAVGQALLLRVKVKDTVGVPAALPVPGLLPVAAAGEAVAESEGCRVA